jgi:hypothetical protein
MDTPRAKHATNATQKKGLRMVIPAIAESPIALPLAKGRSHMIKNRKDPKKKRPAPSETPFKIHIG